MKTITTAVLAACLSMAGATAFAQDAATKGETKKAMSMQDCKDHANTATGQKRNDTPQNADTDKKCAEIKGDHKMMKKHDGMKKDGAATQESPAAPMK